MFGGTPKVENLVKIENKKDQKIKKRFFQFSISILSQKKWRLLHEKIFFALLFALKRVLEKENFGKV